ncbi:MAG: response regulator [Alphaproteobacteria bacterium]|nr:response regulator [Alphaproteobacteria bacterium]
MVDKNIAVLIVEDNTTMRRIESNLVRQLGFNNITEAVDGTDALAKLRAKKIEFIISDWHMEPMTGLELLKQVRADAQLKHIPFIMVTAESKVENILVAKQNGVSNYIVKPFSAEALKTKMVSVLGPF